MNSINFANYKLDENIEKTLFNDSLIFFDTSALLDFYYFSEDSREEIFLKLFQPLANRLWITAQTEYEFLKNREKVLLKPVESYTSLLAKTKGDGETGHVEVIENLIKSIGTNSIKDIKGQLKTLKEKTSKSNKHPYLKDINFDVIESGLTVFNESLKTLESLYFEFKEELQTEINKQVKDLESNSSNDVVLKAFEKYFSTTDPFSYNETLGIISEGELRYKNQIPPGYLDEKSKIGFQKYGDLILWKQILAKCANQNKNVILVINDLKEDWWLFDETKSAISPRHELIKEFSSLSQNTFWMYDINDFLFKSKKYINTDIEENVIKEIKDVTSLQHFLEGKLITYWIFRYFGYPAIVFHGNPNHAPIDYYFNDDSGKTGIIHKRIISHLYTKLLFPIKTIFDACDEIKEKQDIDHLVLVIEYPNYDIAENYMRHLEKKSIRSILNRNKNHLRIIIGTKKDETLDVLFDSEHTKEIND